MRIAFMGDYSALYYNIAIGLRKLGHTVDIYNGENSYKKVPGSVENKYTNKTNSRVIGRFVGLLNLYDKIKKIPNYDIVQFIGPSAFLLPLNYMLCSVIVRKSKKCFLSSARNCYHVQRAYLEGIYKYYMFDDLDYFKGNKLNESLFWNEKLEKELADKFDGIIPISWEYAKAFEEHSNLKRGIQIGVDLEGTEYRENIVHDKIIIFHGVTREGVKGTYLVKPALERLQKKYPDKVECIVDGKMPLADYLQLMQRTNIVIDQCKCLSWGVNAVYAMAQGKVVMSGAEPEAKEYFDSADDCPIINILPDTDDIYNKLEELVLNPDKIYDLGKAGRTYVEKHNDCVDVARQYLDVWSGC